MRLSTVSTQFRHIRLSRFSTTCSQAAQQAGGRQSWQLDREGRTHGFARRRAVPNKPQSASSATESASGSAASPNSAVSQALQGDEQDANHLSAPVRIPHDPSSTLESNHPSVSILANSSVVIQRQIEMMNVFLGFEQANRYVIMDPQGNHIGYLAEQDHGIGNAMARQAFRTHRSFTTHVFDKEEKEVLRFHRPFSWISSTIRVYDAFSRGPTTASTALQGTSAQDAAGTSNASVSSVPISQMKIIGEAQQQWAPLRRKYNLFLQRRLSAVPANEEAARLTAGDLPLSNSTEMQVSDGNDQDTGLTQFAHVDEPFLSWDFSLLSGDQQLIGSVNRNFVGFARELFTDTGVYALRMDSAARGDTNSSGAAIDDSVKGAMTLDQRAVMLATAVSIDFDYFSRHSHAGAGGWWPMWMPWGGAGAGAEAEAGPRAEAGAEPEVAEIGVAAARGAGQVGQDAIAGAGTMAGYEMLQRSREQQQQQQQSSAGDASPQNPEQEGMAPPPNEQSMQQSWPGDSINSQSDDPWASWGDEQREREGDSSVEGGEGSGGDGGGGEGGSFFDDLF